MMTVHMFHDSIYTEGAKKMYTHFKGCYLRKMCIHFLAPSVYTHIQGVTGGTDQSLGGCSLC